MPTPAQVSDRIRALNDQLRQTFQGGRVLVTRGLHALDPLLVARVLDHVRTYSAFTPDNDPYGEHDFGSFEIATDPPSRATETIMWKIDYLDAALEYGSVDPSDPSKTTRVLTIMLASEY